MASCSNVVVVLQAILAKLTERWLGELAGPLALVLGMYMVSSSINNVVRGSGHERGPPLTVVMGRGMLDAEHVTVKREGM